MPPAESPLRCEHCGNAVLVHGPELRMGMLNSLLANLGGPGQEPPQIGNQWAVYLCLQCNGIFPYKKHYAAQPALQAQFDQLHQQCINRMTRIKNLEELGKKLESLVDSFKVTAALPGMPAGNEAILSLKAEMKAIQEELSEFKSELKRRRGGRPKKQ